MAALAAALVATGATAQTKTKSFELKKIFPYLDAYYRLPAQDRNRFTLAYYLTPPSALGMKVDGADVPVGPDGRVRLPSAQQVAAGRQVVLRAKPGTKFSISMKLEPTLRPANRLSAPELAAAISQAQRGIKKAAPVPLRLAAPTMAAVSFVNSGSGEVLMAGGGRAALPVVEGHPRYEPSSWKGAETIVLAKVPAPIEIGPAAKPKKKR